jgi:hypothetical protein
MKHRFACFILLPFFNFGCAQMVASIWVFDRNHYPYSAQMVEEVKTYADAAERSKDDLNVVRQKTKNELMSEAENRLKTLVQNSPEAQVRLFGGGDSPSAWTDINNLWLQPAFTAIDSELDAVEQDRSAGLSDYHRALSTDDLEQRQLLFHSAWGRLSNAQDRLRGLPAAVKQKASWDLLQAILGKHGLMSTAGAAAAPPATASLPAAPHPAAPAVVAATNATAAPPAPTGPAPAPAAVAAGGGAVAAAPTGTTTSPAAVATVPSAQRLSPQQVKAVADQVGSVVQNAADSLDFGVSLDSDPMASYIVSAPEEAWQYDINRSGAFGGMGNTDIAVRVQSNGEFTLKGVRVDADKITKATFTVVKQAVQIVAASYGIPIPTAGASQSTQASSDSNVTGPPVTVDSSIVSQIANANSQAAVANIKARQVRLAAFQLFDSITAHGDQIKSDDQTKRAKAIADIKNTLDTVKSQLNPPTQDQTATSAGTSSGPQAH